MKYQSLCQKVGSAVSDMEKELKILWASDLHLDRVGEQERKRFFAKIATASFDLAVISGDISDSRHVCNDLSLLAQACGKRHCYFVLGNHDFHYSSLQAVDKAVDGLCRVTANLHHLGKGDFHQICPQIALIGHRGWSDGRAGTGVKTKIKSFDSGKIEEFRGCSHNDTFRQMEKLGRQSGQYFKRKLPAALMSSKHVLCITHFPLYYQAAKYGDRPCGFDWQPHFVNQSAGLDLLEIKRAYPHPKLTVLCGHTHSSQKISMRDNIDLQVSAARPGKPDFEIMTF